MAKISIHDRFDAWYFYMVQRTPFFRCNVPCEARYGVTLHLVKAKKRETIILTHFYVLDKTTEPTSLFPEVTTDNPYTWPDTWVVSLHLFHPQKNGVTVFHHYKWYQSHVDWLKVGKSSSP